MSRVALITGITGQDGSYLADFLLQKGYEVHGMVRRASTENFERINHLRDKVELHQADLLDELSLIELMEAVRPDEIYNLAAMSFVPTSWNQPILTSEFTAIGVVRVLEAMRRVCPKARFYQASSSEMFGRCAETPQNELTPFYRAAPMASRRPLATISPSTIARATSSLPSPVSSSTREPAARQGVCHAQGDRRGRPYQLGLQQTLAMGNLDASATGALPATTCVPCG